MYNDAEADRFVLMCEVWHPALTAAEREALVTLFAVKVHYMVHYIVHYMVRYIVHNIVHYMVHYILLWMG